MNELLGWYGYDKVELKDGEDIEFRNYPVDGENRQHISVLKGNDMVIVPLFMQSRTSYNNLPELSCVRILIFFILSFILNIIVDVVHIYKSVTANNQISFVII